MQSYTGVDYSIDPDNVYEIVDPLFCEVKCDACDHVVGIQTFTFLLLVATWPEVTCLVYQHNICSFKKYVNIWRIQDVRRERNQQTDFR